MESPAKKVPSPASITSLRLVGWLAILAGLVSSAILSEETSDLVLVFASFAGSAIFAVFCFGLASLINEVNLLRLDVRDGMQPRPRFDTRTGEPL